MGKPAVVMLLLGKKVRVAANVRNRKKVPINDRIVEILLAYQ